MDSAIDISLMVALVGALATGKLTVMTRLGCNRASLITIFFKTLACGAPAPNTNSSWT